MKKIKLIVGLGNPGAQYAGTRHNAGADYVSLLAQRYHQTLKSEKKFSGLMTRLRLNQSDVFLLIPSTFMNLSGNSVAAVTHYWRILPEEILVAHDDLDLLPGIAKFKSGGGHGGHNGLRDIIQKLGNNREFHRLRIGIGHPGDKNRVSDFVLSQPALNEKKLIDNAIDEAIFCTEIWLKDDRINATNRLNAFKANL